MPLGSGAQRRSGGHTSGSEDPRPAEAVAPPGMAKGRIEALTDGIMAVAMTILVLDLKFDGTEAIGADDHLVRHLIEIERTFTVYLVSFVVLGMYWIAHHLQFHYVRRVDRGVMWINLAFMLLVTLVPFTTERHDRLREPAGAGRHVRREPAAALRDAARQPPLHRRRPALCEPTLTPQVAGAIRRRLLLFSAVPALSIAVAFVSTRAALYLYFLMAVVHFFPRLPTRRRAASSRAPR